MNALVRCFSPQCLAAHNDDPSWTEKVIDHMRRHPSLPQKYMVQVLKDYGLLCRTTVPSDCTFIGRMRGELRRTRRLP
jgi:hypothetical protein